MVFDPTEPDIYTSQFHTEDWSAASYGECKEELPKNAPAPRGISFTMRVFEDSDHAWDSITRSSHTGFIVFLNSAPIHWFSKKQARVEISSFGTEFISMKQFCECLSGLHHKPCMMSIPLEMPTRVFGDNQSVLANASMPHSTLKKKLSSIAFHFVREGVAKNEWLATHLNTNLNPTDTCAKSLPGGEKRARFTSHVLQHVD